MTGAARGGLALRDLVGGGNDACARRREDGDERTDEDAARDAQRWYVTR
jgi:hypothetical protein